MEVLPTMFDASDVSTPGHYKPSQTALLLLDFHIMFVQKVGGSKARAALEVAARVRTWAKSQGIPVIHCLLDLNKTPFSTCKSATRLYDLIAAMNANGGEESTELLQDYGNDVTFTRRMGHVSALKSPGLEDYLQEKGIKSLFLAGLSTSGCVGRTALSASDAEYVVTVISDGCADSKQEAHDMFLQALGRRGYVATFAEVQEGYRKAREI